MLQIRLSKGGSSGDGGGSSAKSALPVETVTVACPDHLVLADLPVAKSLGAITSSASACVRSVGRRSRRHLGERVHFCVRCDFPIAIYGRLMPCEHAFCLACARTDSSCYLCDERIQKIQTIKIMEGIFICAAPHCLKSFLKRSEFEAHIHETHADLVHPNVEKEAGNENPNIMRPSSTDTQKQSLLPEMSTARAPSKPAFSPSSNSQHQDREDRNRRHQSRDPPPRPPLQSKPLPFLNRPQPQSGDNQAENLPQGLDRPFNWPPQPQHAPSFQQNPDQLPSDKATGMPPDTPFSPFPPLPQQPMNYAMPMNMNQTLVSAPTFTYSPFQTDGAQPYFAVPQEVPRQVSAMDGGSEQGSVLGIPPAAPTPVANFQENFPRQWGMGIMGVPLQQPLQMGQGIPEGFGNPSDSQASVSFFQGEFGRMPEGFSMNPPPLPGKEQEQQHPVSMPMTMMPHPPPLPMPPPLSQLQQQQFNRGRDVPPGFGWPNDKRGPD